MAQDFAPLLRSIWTDDDFRALTVEAQHAYLMLLSHPDRNSAGVLSLTVRKWTRLSAGSTPARLREALQELDETGFIVMDEDTEEVLVRAFIRRATVYKHIRMLANALRAVSEVESERLRSALGQELVRLPRLAVPTGNERMAAEAIQTQQRVDELASMFCDAPPVTPGGGGTHGMADGMADALPHGPVVGAGAVVVVGAGAVPGFETKDDLSLESNARARDRRGLAVVPERPDPPRLCRIHYGQPATGCRGCAADAKAAL